MTVAELAERSGRSISDLVALVLSGSRGAAPAARRGRPPGSTNAGGGRRGPRKAAAAPKGGKRGGRKGGGRKGGGAASSGYVDTVLSAVKASKGKVKAEELRKKIGGTPPQLRAALAQLIEAGSVKSAGKARGTTYTAT